MRIAVLTCGLALVCTTTAAGQGMQVGVRGGINLSSLESDGDEALDPHVRGVFGGFVTMRWLSWLEVQPEVLYSMKGAKSDEFGIESKVLLDYVEIPVLARVTRGAFGSRTFYLAGGPSFGLRVRAKTRADFGGSTEELDIKEDVEPFDLGIVIAGGFEFGAIVIDGRYTFGLSDADRTDDVTLKNRVISLTVGYKF